MVATRVGPYELAQRLGRGAAGEVFRAVDTRTGVEVALKVLDRSRANADFVTRFEREARAAATIVHPNVTRVLDSGVAAGAPYLALELVRGGTLRARLKREGALPPAAVAALGIQIAAALEAVHSAGLVHRDLKPENLLLDESGRVRLSDFGLARSEGRSSLTGTGELLGTPEYMSPEQADGQREIDSRADLYAFGVVLFEALTGELPFTGRGLALVKQHLNGVPPRPSERVPRLPRDWDTLVLSLLAKAPEARPRRAASVAEELARLRGLPEPSAGPGRVGVALAVGVVASLALAAVALGTLARRSSAGATPTPTTSPLRSGPTPTPGATGVAALLSATVSPAARSSPVPVAPSPSPSPVIEDDPKPEDTALAKLPPITETPESSPAHEEFLRYWEAASAHVGEPMDPALATPVRDLAVAVLKKDRDLPEKFLARANVLGEAHRDLVPNRSCAAFLLLARSELDKNRPVVAWRDCTRYLQGVQVESPAVLSRRAHFAMALADLRPLERGVWLDSARSDLGNALGDSTLAPDDVALACARLGAVERRRGDLSAALAALDRGLEAPRGQEHSLRVERAAVRLVDDGSNMFAPALAIQDLERALALDGDQPDAVAEDLVRLGDALRASNANDKAEPTYTRAIALGTRFSGLAHEGRLQSRRALQNVTGALEDLDELIDARGDRNPNLLLERMIIRHDRRDRRASDDARAILATNASDVLKSGARGLLKENGESIPKEK